MPAAPPESQSADLRLALQLADLADEITMDRFRAIDLAVETKPDMTPVTEADTLVERTLRAHLESTVPDDALLGEELGAEEPAANGRRWRAARGEGAHVRESVPEHGSAPRSRSISVSRVGELGDAQLCFGGLEDWRRQGREDNLRALAERVWRTRGFGDFWMYMLVAEGAAEIGSDPIASIWDLAAPMVIVTEAGGRFTDLTGTVSVAGPGGGLATNGLLHDEALAILGR